MAEDMQDYFFAMRPFLCLTGQKQRPCWFPVDNAAPLISPDDVLPLEYALIFMRTQSTDLPVNPSNGLYYTLRWTEDGICGTLFEVDRAPFIAPDSLPIEKRPRT